MQTLYQTFTRSVIVKYRDLSSFSPLKLSNFNTGQYKKIKKCSRNHNEFERTVFGGTGRLTVLPARLAFDYLRRYVIICGKCHCSDGPFPSPAENGGDFKFSLALSLPHPACHLACLLLPSNYLMSSLEEGKRLNDAHLVAT